jgi:3-phenylpropionate/trans-cinnamate dioxygenase ferredoxin reductase subunit
MGAGVIIIGAGQAACQAAASLRQMGYAGALTMIGEEAHLPYQRPPLSKTYLKEDASFETVQLRPQSFFETINCQIRVGVRAVGINRQDRLVHLDSGESLEYEQLVLATGARARHYPNLPPAAGKVHYLRTVDDASELSATLARSKRLAIVGAGYVGMEVAASATQLGIEVAVYEAAPRVMQRSVGAVMSAAIEAVHANRGVHLHLNTAIEGINSAADELTIRTANAGLHAFDALVVGIGAEPNTELAAEAGLACGRGILIDESCRTSDPLVFAIGDCTEQAHPIYGAGFRLESVQNALDQAKSAAAAISGKPQPPVSVPWFWSDQYEHRLQVAGLAQNHDESVVRIAPDREAGSVSQSIWYLRDRKVVAVEALDAPKDFMAGRTLIKNGTEVQAERVADASVALKDL